MARHAAGLSSVFSAAAVAALLLPALAQADAVADFYKGKDVRIVSSGGAGGGHGSYTLLLSRYLGRHIPGNPNVVPQYMPGAGGATAFNYVYNAAPRDGTAIGFFLQFIAFNQAVGRPGIRYDASRFNWIGSVTPISEVLVIWRTAPAWTVEGLKTHEVVMGSTGRGSASFITPTLMNTFLGTRMKIVMGYPGLAPVHQAMETGELHGTVGAWSTIAPERRPHWKRGENYEVVAQNALTRSSDLSDVPTLVELAPDDTVRQVFDFVGSASTLGRTLAAPPGVPAERLAALRAAFDRMVKDPDLLAEAAKRHMPIDPKPAAETEALVARTLGAPPAVVSATHKALGLE